VIDVLQEVLSMSDPTEPVVVDCDRCLVRSPGACGDCVVTVLLGAPPEGIELDGDDVAALADGGLVPPLRLVIPLTGPDTHAVGS
jgi:hypothetical protein